MSWFDKRIAVRLVAAAALAAATAGCFQPMYAERAHRHDVLARVLRYTRTDPAFCQVTYTA